MPIPTHVTRDELREAWKPLHDLLGVSDSNVFRDIHLVDDKITFTIPVLAADDPLRGRARSSKSWGREPSDDFPPHPHDPAIEPVIFGEGEKGEYAYEVVVTVVD
jgi:hypothetical protein